MKTKEDIIQLLSQAGFKDFEGSDIDFFIRNYIPYYNHEGQHEDFYGAVWLILYQAINIGRKEIIDSI